MREFPYSVREIRVRWCVLARGTGGGEVLVSLAQLLERGHDLLVVDPTLIGGVGGDATGCAQFRRLIHMGFERVDLAAHFPIFDLAQHPVEVGAADQQLAHPGALGRECPLGYPQANGRGVEVELVGDLRDRQPGIWVV